MLTPERRVHGFSRIKIIKYWKMCSGDECFSPVCERPSFPARGRQTEARCSDGGNRPISVRKSCVHENCTKAQNRAKPASVPHAKEHPTSHGCVRRFHGQTRDKDDGEIRLHVKAVACPNRMRKTDEKQRKNCLVYVKTSRRGAYVCII